MGNTIQSQGVEVQNCQKKTAPLAGGDATQYEKGDGGSGREGAGLIIATGKKGSRPTGPR